MDLRLYNTLTRKKEVFKPINKSEVSFYSCGPTVYSYQHIGNMRTYIFNDLLKRVLIFNNYNVKHVMNYTDVGHLTSDEDTGDDKVEKAAKKEGKSAKEITNFYSKVFESDLEKLDIIKPDIICKATDNIQEQINLIKTLEEKGYTYRTSDGIYFDTSKLNDYGKLARLNIKNLEEGKRVDVKEKRNKTDFALWKFSEKPMVRQQEWESPWGVGFPGWHIECSAMSSKYLGEQFDIHTGGEDHIPVHHTNEIVQSECAFGKEPWVKYWLHSAFLTFNGKKISKSTGGLFTVSELEEKGFDPLDFRYLCLTTNYRKKLNFSLEGLESAKKSYDKLKNIINDIKNKNDSKGSIEKYKKEFLSYVNDDLNVSKGLALLWSVLRSDLGSKQKYSLTIEFDKVLGLKLNKIKEENIPKEILDLVNKREKYRKENNWKKSDELRDLIKKKCYEVKDTKEGSKISKQ
jgi:cysteinyl-tRNA synthetase